MLYTTRKYVNSPAETLNLVDGVNTVNHSPKSHTRAVVALFVSVLAVLAVKHAPEAGADGGGLAQYRSDLAKVGITDSGRSSAVTMWGGMACQYAHDLGPTSYPELIGWIQKTEPLTDQQAKAAFASARANLCDTDGNLIPEMK